MPKCSVSELMLRLCCLLQTVELSICKGPSTGLKLDEQCSQFGAVKLPLKRRRVLIGKLFIQGQPEPDRFQVGHIIGCQHLPLNDREVDLDLIEPTGVDRRMDQNDTRIDLTQPLLRSGAAMRRTVVDNPEQPFAGPIRFLSQHLGDKPAKGEDTRRRFTPAHDASPAHIPGGQILQSPAPLVFVLDIGGAAWGRRQGGMAADTSLDAGFLVSTEDVVLGTKELTLPFASIQVQ